MNFSRRQFLRATGISLALPCLDGFRPSHARASTAPARRRMVCICAPLGFYPPNFFPEQAGGDYELTTHLELLSEYRNDFTVISGLMHTGNSPGFAHQATASFLTGAEGAGRPGFRNSI